MKRILLKFRTEMDEQFRPSGVTTAQMQVLFAIRSAPGRSGAQLARSCFVTPQSAQALLKQLESDGFILRQKDAVNDRILTAEITTAGERLARSVEKKSEEMQKRLWHNVSDRELALLNAVLGKCIANFDGSA